MVVVSAQATGAEDFIEAVWQGGELFVDEDEAFKKALGGLPYKNRWLFKPSVLARLGSVVGNGRDFSDLNDKSQMLGGTMVVDRSGVLFAKPESESFAHAEVDEVLEAMRAGNVAPTPATRDDAIHTALALQAARSAGRSHAADDAAFDAAFHETVRQVYVHCAERGEVLRGVHAEYGRLFEVARAQLQKAGVRELQEARA